MKINSASKKIMRHTFFITCLLGALIPYLCQAEGGFSLLQQSSEAVGHSFSGGVTGYGDGSEAYYNPAAMSYLSSNTGSFSIHYIDPQLHFNNNNSMLIPELGGSGITGSDGGEGGDGAIAPNLYMVTPLDDAITLGLSINAPFGLSTNYSSEWVGRYQALETSLTVVNIAPAIALKVNHNFTIGASVSAVYSDGTMSNAIDFGTIGLSTLGLPTASALGLLPQNNDGRAEFKGDDWGFGYTIGAIYNYCQENRIGFAYHSKVDLTLAGQTEFTVPTEALPLTSTGLFGDTHSQADLTLPDSISVGIKHSVSDSLALLAESSWTHWTYFDELKLDFNSDQPSSITNENWNNTWRFSGGAEYKYSDRLTLSAGYTFEEDPIADRFHRTPRLPSTDRHWLNAGANYQIKEGLNFILSYGHIFEVPAKSEVLGATGDNFRGDWNIGMQTISSELVWQF